MTEGQVLRSGVLFENPALSSQFHSRYGELKLLNERLSAVIIAESAVDTNNQYLVAAAKANPQHNRDFLANRWTPTSTNSKNGTARVLLFDVPASTARLKWVLKYPSTFNIVEGSNEWGRFAFYNGPEIEVPIPGSEQTRYGVEALRMGMGLFNFSRKAREWSTALRNTRKSAG